MDTVTALVTTAQATFDGLSPVGKAATALVAFGVLWKVVSHATRRRWSAKGQVVVITGASSGIGAEVAKQYADEGAKLILFARRQNELEEVKKQCLERGAQGCEYVVGDVSIRDDCERLMNTAGSKFGGIDCVVLNAGISMGQYFEDLENTDIIRRLMDVNYHGCVDCMFFAIPYLKKSKQSKIVVVSSLAGRTGAPTRTGYCGSKFALQGFFDALRMELGPKYGTTVTMICPGPVRTDINRTRLGAGKQLNLDLDSGIPVEKAGNLIVNANAYGTRLELFGIDGKIGHWTQFFLPVLTEKFVIRKVETMLMAKEKKNA